MAVEKNSTYTTLSTEYVVHPPNIRLHSSHPARAASSALLRANSVPSPCKRESLPNSKSILSRASEVRVNWRTNCSAASTHATWAKVQEKSSGKSNVKAKTTALLNRHDSKVMQTFSVKCVPTNSSTRSWKCNSACVRPNSRRLDSMVKTVTPKNTSAKTLGSSCLLIKIVSPMLPSLTA